MFERYADYYRSANSNTRYSMHRTSSVGNRADSMQSRMSRSESVGMPPMLGIDMIARCMLCAFYSL